MLYVTADPNWSLGQALHPDPSRPPFSRRRAEADAAAQGRPTLAVAVRFDAALGVVVPEGPVARERAPGWWSAAALRPQGGITVDSAIPGSLVRVVGRSEVRLHPGVPRPARRPRVAPGFRATSNTSRR